MVARKGLEALLGLTQADRDGGRQEAQACENIEHLFRRGKSKH
jgi:hypothetical protein